MRKRWNAYFSMAAIASLLLNACRPQGPSSPEKEGIEPISPSEIAPNAIITQLAGGDFNVIPTPDAITNSEGAVRYPTETYFASKLNVCVAHPFNKDGGAEMPSILTACKPIPNLEANEVALRGDLIEVSDDGYVSFTNNDGSEGYATKNAVAMTLQEVQTWVNGMALNESGKVAISKVLHSASENGVDISVVFKLTLNTAVDPNGAEKLVDMLLEIGFQANTKGAPISVLSDTLQPFGKTDLLRDLQVAGVEVMANQLELDEIVLNVYPSNWVEIGDQRFVSPEFVTMMDKIAASGERFTLKPDGTVQDGATTIPGLHVAPDGKVTITVNGEQVEIDPSIMDFDDEKGFSIEGFEDADGDGEWGVAQLTPEEQLALDMGKFNLDLDKDGYKIEYDADGKIELRNNSGRLVYWDGKWSSEVIVDMVGDSGKCEQTPFVWTKGANGVDLEQEYDFTQYMGRLFLSISSLEGVKGNGSRAQPIGKIGEVNICWGMWVGGSHFEETMFVWKDMVEGKAQVEQVFQKE